MLTEHILFLCSGIVQKLASPSLFRAITKERRQAKEVIILEKKENKDKKTS